MFAVYGLYYFKLIPPPGGGGLDHGFQNGRMEDDTSEGSAPSASFSQAKGARWENSLMWVSLSVVWVVVSLARDDGPVLGGR